MSELTFKAPNAKTPGYLRRAMEAEEHRKKLVDGTANHEDLINWLLIYVIEPADRDEARDVLLDLSFEQYLGLLDVIKAPPEDSENPT